MPSILFWKSTLPAFWFVIILPTFPTIVAKRRTPAEEINGAHVC